MYWKPTSQLGLRTCLGPFPLLFGIWHCYKHAIELFFRSFRPFHVYSDFNTVCLLCLSCCLLLV